MSDTQCIFCKIINKEIPCTPVYEDADVLAFMDIGPIIKGHILVVPKTHYDPITETPDDVLAKLIAVCKKVAIAQKEALGAEGFNIMQNNGKCSGQEVPHIHFHVIPRFADDGHHWHLSPKKYDDLDEMSGLAKKIADAVK